MKNLNKWMVVEEYREMKRKKGKKNEHKRSHTQKCSFLKISFICLFWMLKFVQFDIFINEIFIDIHEQGTKKAEFINI